MLLLRFKLVNPGNQTFISMRTVSEQGRCANGPRSWSLVNVTGSTAVAEERKLEGDLTLGTQNILTETI